MHGDLHPGNILVQGPNNITEPKMVLLDCGIATSLTPHDLENLLCVFTAIVTNQGWKVADLFLAGQTCPTLEEYRREVGTLINTAVLKLNLKEVRKHAYCIILCGLFPSPLTYIRLGWILSSQISLIF